LDTANVEMLRAAALLILATAAAPSLAISETPAAIEEKASACAACHGESGKPQERDAPFIWGQHAGYLYIQLRDFKNGDRKNEAMNGLVADMSRDDMLKLAEYFSKKPWPRGDYRVPEADVARARRAIAAGQCVECHLGGLLGNSVIPRLAGQQPEYLKKTMLDFKTKARANNSAMTDLFKTYSDEDLAAMAGYLAAQ
jgi:cytochrome c553